MRSITRLLLAVAAISAVSIPVAHAQFGFGGSPGSGTTSNGLPGLGSGAPGFTNPFSNGLPGLGALSRDNTTNDTTDTNPAPAPAPAPTQAGTSDWACPEGFTPQLDEDGNWVKDAAGVPQCVEATFIADF
jgi:hypothetical protein